MLARRLTMVALAVAAFAVGIVLAVAVVVPILNAALVADESPEATPAASPTWFAHAPMSIAIPADADCSACHTTNGQIGLRPIPAMAHPVEGWRNCTACHKDGSLVKTAPGHTGIGKELCLACHKPADATASALPRPHHVVAGVTCVTCHGANAPLPTDMAGRSNCWICHPDADSASLFGNPIPTVLPSP